VPDNIDELEVLLQKGVFGKSIFNPFWH